MTKNKLIEKVRNKALMLGLMSLSLENISSAEAKDAENFTPKDIHKETITTQQETQINQGDSIFTETQKKISQQFSQEGLSETISNSSTKKYLLGDGYEMISSYNEEFSNSPQSASKHDVEERLVLKTSDNRLVDCSGLFNDEFISSQITYHTQNADPIQYSAEEVKNHNDTCLKSIKIAAMQKLSKEDYPYFMKFVQDRRMEKENLNKEKTASMNKMNVQQLKKSSQIEL